MMTDYWREHFYVLQDIVNSDDTLYIKLNNILFYKKFTNLEVSLC